MPRIGVYGGRGNKEAYRLMDWTGRTKWLVFQNLIRFVIGDQRSKRNLIKETYINVNWQLCKFIILGWA